MKVSVLMITYDHAAFIRQAVESALAQKTEFEYEIVIGEDCSTDGTRRILLDLQRSHPNRIRLLLHHRNLGMHENFIRVLNASQGDHIALLEGDDFWLSPHKLQKQVDYLTVHPECSMCCHNAKVIFEEQNREPDIWNPAGGKNQSTLEDIISSNFIATCSAMMRRECIADLPEWYARMRFGDWPLFIWCARKGFIGYLDEVMAAYRVHHRGVWSSRSTQAQLEEIAFYYEDLNLALSGQHTGLIKKALSRAYYDLSCSSSDDRRRAKTYALKSLKQNPINPKSLFLFCAPNLFHRLRKMYRFRRPISLTNIGLQANESCAPSPDCQTRQHRKASHPKQ